MRARGDLAVELRLLARPRGIIGTVGAIAGSAAFASSYIDWYAVVADVSMLGASRGSTVASLAGWQAHPWGWLVPAISVAAMLIGWTIAFDRSRKAAGRWLAMTGLMLSVAVAFSGVLFPPVSRFDVAGSRLREMLELADRLPSDVSLTFSVRPAAGMWIALVAAAVLVVVGLLDRDG